VSLGVVSPFQCDVASARPRAEGAGWRQRECEDGPNRSAGRRLEGRPNGASAGLVGVAQSW